MNKKPVQCPSCGQSATGRFCSHCGTAIGSTCPSCGTKVKSGARLCQACGASLTTREEPKRWTAQTIAPWAALGIATVALIMSVVSLIDQDQRAAPPVPVTLPLPPPVPTGQAVDLSSMTPRQAADRLFNRVMVAHERGDTAEARQFAPMALEAYERLGTLDNDARYHVALIHMTVGDVENARVSLDKLRQSVPNHLLGIMLEHQIAEHNGDQASAAQAYKAFLAAYETEIAAGRTEYQDHRGGIERFRQAAEASMAAKK